MARYTIKEEQRANKRNIQVFRVISNKANDHIMKQYCKSVILKTTKRDAPLHKSITIRTIISQLRFPLSQSKEKVCEDYTNPW